MARVVSCFHKTQIPTQIETGRARLSFQECYEYCNLNFVKVALADEQ